MEWIEEASAVDGITVWAPRGEPETEGATATFACASCGATVGYDPVADGLKCRHCGHLSEVRRGTWQDERREFTLEALRRAEHGWGVARQAIYCGSCGGEVALPDDGVLATSCPFCASNVVEVRPADDRAPRPEAVVPFALPITEVPERVRAWLGNDSWMHPRAMHRLARVDRFVGMYLPFWRFRARIDGSWRAMVGHNAVKVVEVDGVPVPVPWVDWHEERGDVDHTFDEILVPGTTHLSGPLLRHIEPYRIAEASPYEPAYLAGWRAAGWTHPLPDAWRDGRARIRDAVKDVSNDAIQGDYRASLTVHCDFHDESWQCVLLPVYLSTYRYGGRTHHVVVNGQTGEVGGSRPVIWWRVYLRMLLFLLPGTSWVFCVGVPLSPFLIGIFLMMWPGCWLLKWGWRRQKALHAAALLAEARSA